MSSREAIVLALVAFVGTFSEGSPYDTIIVGMGVSGCTAASAVLKAGKRVLALEAQNIVGGRVHTVAFGDGVVELGAEWINGEEIHLAYELAKQHNISVLSQNTSFQLLRSGGSNVDKEIITELVKKAKKIAAETPKEPESFGKHVTKRLLEYIAVKHPVLLNDRDFLNQFFHFMSLKRCSNGACNNWNELTTHSKFKALKGYPYWSLHKHGYKTLLDILLNTYKGGPGYPNLNLQLEKVVTKISYPQEPTQDVEVSCEDGSTYRARSVIVTVSLGVLKEGYSKLFTPVLPQSKITAIKDISMGLIGKIILLFPNPWWPQNSSDANSFFWTQEDREGLEQDWISEVSGSTVSMGNRNAMTLWTSGDTTKLVETLPEDVVKSKAMALIRRFMGKDINIPEPIKVLRTTWYSNPYTRGTYSFDNIQTPLHPDIRDTLAEPLVDSSGTPRVLFAGEATNSIHFGTVHGAAESGYREATGLVHELKKVQI